jgi:hypothetical protein
VSYIWETIEHYLETTGPDIVINWLAGVEFWANRIITDNIFVFLGYLYIARHPQYITMARVFSFTWLFIHLFIFPDSMYLHELFPFEIPYIWGAKANHAFDFWSIEHFFTGMSIGYIAIYLYTQYTSLIKISESMPSERRDDTL